MNIIKYLWKFKIKPMITFINVHSSKGRELRIDKLVIDYKGKYNRDSCAMVVYARDSKYSYYFDNYEYDEIERIKNLLNENKIEIPMDRAFLVEEFNNIQTSWN